jgi:hypothetical protein
MLSLRTHKAQETHTNSVSEQNAPQFVAPIVGHVLLLFMYRLVFSVDMVADFVVKNIGVMYRRKGALRHHEDSAPQMLST